LKIGLYLLDHCPQVTQATVTLRIANLTGAGAGLCTGSDAGHDVGVAVCDPFRSNGTGRIPVTVADKHVIHFRMLLMDALAQMGLGEKAAFFVVVNYRAIRSAAEAVSGGCIDRIQANG
jgi:hypothetical protein